jgi:hypothetical protein
MQRRETFKLGLTVAVTPEMLGRVLSDAAAEAMILLSLPHCQPLGEARSSTLS